MKYPYSNQQASANCRQNPRHKHPSLHKRALLLGLLATVGLPKPVVAEDCISFDPEQIEVRQTGEEWKLVKVLDDRLHPILGFGNNEAEATKALNLIRTKGFNRICVVARPDPSMVYFKREAQGEDDQRSKRAEGEQKTELHLQAAMRFLEASGLREKFISMNEGIESNISSKMDDIEVKKVVKRFFEVHFQWEAIRDDIARLYANTFTRDELQRLRQFYETDPGRKLTEEKSRLMDRATSLLTTRFQERLPELKNAVAATLRKRNRSVREIYSSKSTASNVIQALTGGPLNAATSTTVSPDGRYVYTAAWKGNALGIFERDSGTVRLKFQRAFKGPKMLDGSVALRLSPEGELAGVATVGSKMALLFGRDAESGDLEYFDGISSSLQGTASLRDPNDVAFSKNGRFLFVADAAGGLASLEITPSKKLRWLDYTRGEDFCFRGARGIAKHPDAPVLYVTSCKADTLTAVSYDQESGETEVQQILSAEGERLFCLDGAFGVGVSPDGRFVYTSAGRFGGRNAVGVFRVGSQGKLHHVQSLENGRGGINGLKGCNEVMVSPEGKRVFVAATGGNAVGIFARDNGTGRLTYSNNLSLHTGGAAGLSMGPEGRHLYIAAENEDAVSVYVSGSE